MNIIKIENINKLITQHRQLVDLTETLLTGLFSVCLETKEALTEASKNLEESKSTITKYQEEIKKLYQELADFRHNKE